VLLSYRSRHSFLSICSDGSVLSVGSVGSVLSVGSIGSLGAIGSIGSVMSVLSMLSAQSNCSILSEESKALGPEKIQAFRKAVVNSKLGLHALLRDVKAKGARVFGVGAPSRASTLINYVGLDDGILDAVVEIKGSYKIGKYIPGTVVPVIAEEALFEQQPEYALLLSWHIADELIPKLTARGYKGSFIVPLPEPHIVKGQP
jgi:hypothetical protein